jgi:glycosyltransferase involved in cell wall biosynthesis
LDVENEYSKAELFVLPSKYESFGLATAEAILNRLPVVGFADCPGTNTLIQHGVNGLLVPGAVESPEKLSDALASLMSSPALRMKLSSSSAQDIIDSHSIDAVLDRWEDLLRAALRRKSTDRIGE